MQTIDQATHFEFTLGTDIVPTEHGWMHAAHDLEDKVNALVESLKDQDVVIGIGGRIVDTRYNRRVANGYGTGKMSIRTKANKGSGSFDVWVRPGDTFRLTVYPR